MEASKSSRPSAKAAHVNMMTDTIVANLPPEALRSIVRGLLGVDSKVTPAFHNLALKYLLDTKPQSTPTIFANGLEDVDSTIVFDNFRSRYRCLMGCGHGFETLSELAAAVRQVSHQTSTESEPTHTVLSNIDGDLVQAVTAIQKELSTSGGMRSMTESETQIISNLRDALVDFEKTSESLPEGFPFARGASRLGMLQSSLTKEPESHPTTMAKPFTSTVSTLPSIKLGEDSVPRMFMGLWQFSSPAWGTASRAKINDDFRKHVDAGLIAYDMADHYGDAEITFGRFRASQADSNAIYCATKWCVFEPVKVTPDLVKASVTERIANIKAASVDLLQFHWQDYADAQYVEAARLIEQDKRVKSLGLCNFDTVHMDEIIGNGVQVVSNQVQFSLIDLRPTFKMAASCRKYQVKLLTYGSLCGGLLAEKWLGKSSPNLFDENMTPSHRKYLEMIMVWGGWSLFQELLSALASIGKKHSVSLSNVAVAWTLSHDYVGAVIIGARMGISEHVEDNLKVFSFKLDLNDLGQIQDVLDRCRAREVYEAMGDCGSEYRQ